MNQLIQDAQDSIYIRVYGVKAMNIESDKNDLSVLGQESGQPSLVKVVALGYGVDNSSCFKVPPFYLLLPGDGKPAECSEMSFPKEVKVWLATKNSHTLRLDGTSGTFAELLTVDEPDDIQEGEKLLKDYVLDGGLKIKKVDISDSRICVHYKIWAEAKVKVFGSWVKLASFSHSGKECIIYDACVTVFDAAIFKAELCFYTNPNRVCVKINAVGLKITHCEKV